MTRVTHNCLTMHMYQCMQSRRAHQQQPLLHCFQPQTHISDVIIDAYRSVRSPAQVSTVVGQEASTTAAAETTAHQSQ